MFGDKSSRGISGENVLGECLDPMQYYKSLCVEQL